MVSFKIFCDENADFGENYVLSVIEDGEIIEAPRYHSLAAALVDIEYYTNEYSSERQKKVKITIERNPTNYEYE